jgi:hypothetical protein
MNNLKTIRNEYIEAAEDIFNVEPGSILQATKGSAHESFARFYVYDRLRSRHWSLNRIGNLMGRDHSSVVNGLRQYKNAHLNPNHKFHSIIQRAIFEGKIEVMTDDQSF